LYEVDVDFQVAMGNAEFDIKIRRQFWQKGLRYQAMRDYFWAAERS
jgi:hypothetical protein